MSERIGGVLCSESDGSDSDSHGPVKALVNYKKGWKRTCPRDYPKKTLEPAQTKRNSDVPWQNESYMGNLTPFLESASL